MKHSEFILNLLWMFEQMNVYSMQELLFRTRKEIIISDSDDIWRGNY